MFSYAGYDAVTMKMLGVHQYENAVAAMLAAELFLKNILQEKECAGTESLQHAIREGIDRTQWMGRMELVSNDPFFLMDGAHNSNGVEALKKVWRQCIRMKNSILSWVSWRIKIMGR